MKLLYAGRLSREKGVHTAVRALARVAQSEDMDAIGLDIVGAGSDEYEQELKVLVTQLGLSTVVTFRGAVPRAEMPQVLARYDALLFPSEWEEPFARIVLEAMASGLVVIGTSTGGTGEVLVHNETGLTFPPGDATALATEISRLRNDPALGQRLRDAGRERLTHEFTFERMVDQLETVLQEIAADAPR